MNAAFAMLGAALAAATPTAEAPPAAPKLIAVDQKGGSDANGSPDGRYIVTTSYRDKGQGALWLLDRNDGRWRQLTPTGNNDREPSFAADSRHIVFSSYRGDQPDLWMVDIVTGKVSRLTNDAQGEEYPAWSPDAKSVVYTAGAWKQQNFYVVGTPGPGETLSTPRPVLTKAGHVGACRYATNASLLCHVYERSFGDLVEVDVKTGRTQQLTDGGWWHYKADRSPTGWTAFTLVGEDGDVVRFLPSGSRKAEAMPAPSFAGRWPHFVKQGKELLYHRQVVEGKSIALVNLKTGVSEKLPVAGPMTGSLSLSPDGRRVAYCRGSGESSAIWIYDRDKGAETRVPLAKPACQPVWSPDGKRLAAAVREGDSWAIATLRADGTGLVRLAGAGERFRKLDTPPTWSPDGRRIAFAATTAAYESDLFVVDAESGALRNVTSDNWYDEGPSWGPDGQSLVFMSTRGGDWTWGLFRMSLADGKVDVLQEPGSIERRFPQLDKAGGLWWIESDLCLGNHFVVEQRSGAAPRKLLDLPGAESISRSAGGDEAAVLIVDRRTEFWSVDLAGWL